MTSLEKDCFYCPVNTAVLPVRVAKCQNHNNNFHPFSSNFILCRLQQILNLDYNKYSTSSPQKICKTSLKPSRAVVKIVKGKSRVKALLKPVCHPLSSSFILLVYSLKVSQSLSNRAGWSEDHSFAFQARTLVKILREEGFCQMYC